MAKTDNLTDFLTGVAGAIRTKKGTTALINPQDFESEIGSIDTAKPEQTKTLTVTENGTQTVKPDTGKVLSGVTVTTNVPATPTEEKTVDLAMASGNQVVTPASGKHLTKVTITKPATLAAGNIKSGVNIGGVTGTLSPAKTEQAKTVDLAMASGNQVVSPDSGKVLSGVTITKPATLVASNIKKGVTIGGVAGSLSPAKPEQSKDVGLDMASGSQVVEPDTGKVLSGVTIYKPNTMTADNIRKGVNIGGVVGSYAPTFTTETKTVDLAMGSGNQVISKSSGKDGMTQVTITKPSTMLPVNIKKGVNIGGVTGTYEGESSGGGSSDKFAKLVDGTITEVTAEDLAGVTQIRSYGFRGCNSLTSVTIGNGVTSIGNYAFEFCRGLTSVTTPDGVTSIGASAFKDCSSLTSITIPDSVASIDTSAFTNCSSLTSITIPSRVTFINESTFKGCSSLTSVTIGNGVTSIGAWVFYGCSSLTSITIPNKVTSIGRLSLQIGSSTNKAVITMKPTTPPQIQNNSFNKNYLKKIIVPKGTGATYKAATNWSALASYIQEATT